MNDTIQFICPQCSHQMQLPVSLVGKQGKCPSCAQVVNITQAPPALPPATPPSAELPVPPSSQPGVQQPIPQQAPIQQQAPVQQQAIPGLGQGSSSANIFRVFVNFWWLMIFYGMPITCRIPIAAGHSGATAVDAVAGLFLSRGFAKRTFGAKLVSGITLKCPGAVFAIRDVRVKESGGDIHVIGYRKDISHILRDAGLLAY
jgi:hypothetical protein